MKTNQKMLALIVFFICTGSVVAFAGDFDGSRPILCSTVDLIECEPGGNCQRVTHDSINAPRFIKIDFKEKSINDPSVGKQRPTTRIERMEHVDGKLILQGAEEGIEGVRDGLGWSLSISEDTGDMVLTGSGDQVGFVVFGNCILQ
ncbi:MAG: hypothetical protein JRF72_22855 [Deltaproteobacteria bacterium]|jgi:hypothetical protein|nr:hypothetical protein [Deltaproteobacteria bacterium]